MSKEILISNSREEGQARAVDFESLFSKVVEQDGIVMCTPSGMKKRVARKHKVKECDASLFKVPTDFNDGSHKIEEFDIETVACLIKRHEEPEEEIVKINFKSHERSPYVVSLRDFTFNDSDDRVCADEQMAHCLTMPVQTLKPEALVSETLRTCAHPWSTADQFTTSTMAKRSRLKLFFKSLKLEMALQALSLKRSLIGIRKKETVLEEQIESQMERMVAEAEAPRISFVKAVIGFFILAVVITLPAQALVLYRQASNTQRAVEDQGMAALADLTSAYGSNGSVTADKLSSASGKFQEAGRLLDQSRVMAVSAATVMPSKYRSAKALLEVGDKLSQAGSLLALGFGKIFDDSSRGIIERVEVLGAYARGIQPLLSDAEKAAASVDPSALPKDKQGQIAELSQLIGQSKESVRQIAVLSDALVGFLGKDGMRTYLLVFQNNAELRPSGGFIGSMAEITVDDGKIISVYVPKGGSYDLKGQLTERVRSPEPLQLINAQWQFQDANWFADFPKTAEKLRWFWSKSGQPTLDGLIAVNATFMQDVLKVTGPIDMPEYGKTITADNFIDETQKAVELEYDKKANTPKKIIGDLFDKLMERSKSFTKEEWLGLAAAASQSLDTKEIQVAMFKPAEEDLVERFGWNGQIKSTPGDSLAIIGTNIAGQKTDGVINEKVSHTAHILSDGKIVDTVRLSRAHSGVKGEMFRGVRNVEYLRVYVPKGSELISASGFETPPANLFKQPLETDPVDKDVASVEATQKKIALAVTSSIEDDRTVFGGWMQLDPGQNQEIVLSYALPFKAQDILQKINEASDSSGQARGAYLLLLTSQSGRERALTQNVQADQPWSRVWTRDAVHLASATSSKDNGVVWSGSWDRDQAVAALFSVPQNDHD